MGGEKGNGGLQKKENFVGLIKPCQSNRTLLFA